MKLVASIVAFALAIGMGAFMIVSIAAAEVTVNTANAQGVYNLETGEFSGVISGWSSSGGFGSAAGEVKAAAKAVRNRNIAIGGGGAAVCLIIGSKLLIGERKARSRIHTA